MKDISNVISSTLLMKCILYIYNFFFSVASLSSKIFNLLLYYTLCLGFVCHFICSEMVIYNLTCKVVNL